MKTATTGRSRSWDDEERGKVMGREERIRNNGSFAFRWTDAVYICILAVFSYGCMKLFYRMTLRYQGRYPSDMKYYVDVIKDGEAIHDARL